MPIFPKSSQKKAAIELINLVYRAGIKRKPKIKHRRVKKKSRKSKNK